MVMWKMNKDGSKKSMLNHIEGLMRKEEKNNENTKNLCDFCRNVEKKWRCFKEYCFVKMGM